METHLNLIGSRCSEWNVNWEEVVCPVCLEFPHNAVLLQCSSFKRGCRPFICDTDESHSNCLGRFRIAYNMTISAQSSLDVGTAYNHIPSTIPDTSSPPSCPLCRGTVTGWIVVHIARKYLNLKVRCCGVKDCTYKGDFTDLQKHAKLNHPGARPSEIDSAKKLAWDNMQQSLEIVDVLSTIQSEVPHGVVLGDFVIEYSDDESGDEFEDFPGDEGNWWTSCILYHVFDNIRSLGNRSSRISEARLEHQGLGSDISGRIEEHSFDETDDEMIESDNSSGGASINRSSRRRRLFSSRHGR